MTKNWPGIRKATNHGKISYLVDARHAGKGERRFFSTKTEAESWAQIQRIRRHNEGGAAFDDSRLAKYGWTVSRAIQFAIDHLERQAASVPVSEAVAALIQSKRAAGRSKDYLATLAINLGKLSSTFGARPISSISTPEVEAFLAKINLAPSTKNTIRRDCVTLWTHALKAGWVAENAAEKTDMVTAIESTPGIFTPAQAASLLSASSGDLLAFHSIGLFAGLRVAEIHKLDWQDVDLGSGFIHVTAAKSKTRSRRLVPILKNLRAWIQPIAKISGPIVEKNFRRRQLATRIAAGITVWPDNVMRHSFVSYRLAATGNAAQTALESGHDQAVLFRHYRELVKPKDAKRYWELLPESELATRKVIAIKAA